MSSSTWDKRSTDLSTRELAAHEGFARRVKWAEEQRDLQLERIARERENLEGARGDLEVRVRMSPGPAKTVYHTVDGYPCGRRPDFAMVLLESEAKRQGLRRCTSCVFEKITVTIEGETT